MFGKQLAVLAARLASRQQGLAQETLAAVATRSISSSAALAEPAFAETAIADGAPRNMASRKVTIYSPARAAGQQGLALTLESGAPAVKLDFGTQDKWINPLIGWTSTADPLECLGRWDSLYFDSFESAIAFAKKQGWDYEVREPNLRSKARPKRFIGYGDNFSVKRKGLPVGGLRSEQQAVKK